MSLVEQKILIETLIVLATLGTTLFFSIGYVFAKITYTIHINKRIRRRGLCLKYGLALKMA